MTTQTGDARILICEEIRYGKPVRSEFGPLYENAPYGINSVTAGIENPLQFVPAKFLGDATLASNMIDPEYTRRGALIVKAVKEGLAIMRLRYRAEAGEGEGGRQFLLARTLLLPGIQYWHEIPAGLFAWSEQALNTYPFVFDQPTTPAKTKIELPPFKIRDVNWYDGLSRSRQVQLGSAFQAITRRVGWAVSGVVAEEETQRPASLIAADLDIITSFPRKFSLRVDDTDRFILNLGLSPDLTPGAISYFPAQRGGAFEAPDLQALRVAIIRSKNEISPDLGEPPGEYFFDSLDRRIGRDPIPLKVAPHKTPY